MFSKLEIKITADGSSTIYLPDIDEHYHSVNGAINESMHVYISAGFKFCTKSDVSVFELGFGTGLNALLTFAEAQKMNRTVKYISMEIHPLSSDTINHLNFSKVADFKDSEKIFDAIHAAPWNEPVKIDNRFTLTKIRGDIHYDIPVCNIDVIYYDAFGPDKQPDIWTPEIFASIYFRMNPGAILTTYCAKGAVKRMLKKTGFMIESLPGPAGKREMVRALKS